MQTNPTDQQTATQHVEDVAAPLETITHRGYGTRTVFRDWVTLILTALTEQEERYCEIVQSYPNDRDRGDREADLFARAFGELQSAMADLNRDVLGEVYEHLGLQNAENGQHFTPHPVCKMKTELILGNDDDVGSVKDPACGSGRLLMEAGRLAPDAFFAGRDNDRLCAQMAALNMCFFNLDAVIIHGNSLKLTRRAAWRTIQTPFGGEIQEVDPDELAEFDEAAFGDDTESESASESETENRAKRAGDSEEVSLSVSSEQAGLDAFTP